MPTFRARFNGTCAACGKPILAQAHYISWSRKQRNSTRHRDCLAPTESGSDDGFDGKGNGGEGQERKEAPKDAQGSSESGAGEESKGNGSTPPPAGDSERRVAEIATSIARQLDAESDAAILATVGNGLKALESFVKTELANATPFKIEMRKAEGQEDSEPKVALAHHAFKTLFYYVAKKKHHVYLYGPPGSGKSAAASQCAKAMGREYGYTSLNPWTPESRLLGHPDLSLDGKGRYVETLFIRLFEHGGVYCIDEMDNASPALLNVLNSCLEEDAEGNGWLGLPHRMVKRHPDFVLVAGGNTTGRGGDTFFPERRAFDAAFASRFTFIFWDYDMALEKVLVLRRNHAGTPWLVWGRKVRSFCKTQSIRLICGPREIRKLCDVVLDGAAAGLTMETMAHDTVFKGLDVDTVKRILSAHPLPALGASATDV